jgi:hypothetical protein
MNQRIKELALEAGRTGLPYSEIEIQKFAELIIRECAAQAEEESSWPYSSFGKKIKQHFGVEE